jgi:SAM-dependent methyltransferase
LSDVTLIVAWTPEFREAPEFVTLQEWVRTQAERVWEHVESVADAADAARHRPLLIIGDRCLIGNRSLKSMLRAIEGGAQAVVPRRLANSGLPELDTVRTLSGIEHAESWILEAETGAAAPESPPYAAVLLSPEASKNLSGRAPVSILAGDGVPDGVVTKGLCHEFIDYYGEAREDILPYLDADCREVLEVGCGRGATGALLQDRLGCRVTGVELNPVVARAAAERLHRVVVGDILEVDPGGPFDAVVACELFEHLTEQGLFLRRLREWLRPGGRAVLSVPNVGHHSVVGDLLAGRWDYLPVGLLCSTHYRFFTRRTLEDVLRAAGFEDFEIISQPTEPPTWLNMLPEDLKVDAESLATQGFYVVIRMP